MRLLKIVSVPQKKGGVRLIIAYLLIKCKDYMHQSEAMQDMRSPPQHRCPTPNNWQLRSSCFNKEEKDL